jgi:hypothetical protein
MHVCQPWNLVLSLSSLLRPSTTRSADFAQIPGVKQLEIKAPPPLTILAGQEQRKKGERGRQQVKSAVEFSSDNSRGQSWRSSSKSASLKPSALVVKSKQEENRLIRNGWQATPQRQT